MFRFEKKALTWIERNSLFLAVIFVTLLSMYVRYTMRFYESIDATTCLLPWYDEIAANGGFPCLKNQVGDYNMLYQTIIAIFTYLPIKPLYAYKMLSVGFDYLLAAALAWLVYLNTERDLHKSAVAYIIAIMLPTICLNSACWAQCDSIYTFWAVLALAFFCKEQYVPCFISYGISFAFKLQAVFFLPFFLFVYVYKKRFSILHFLFVPVSMILLSIGGLLQGRKVWDVFTIYFDQTNGYHAMSLNIANLWDLLREISEYDAYMTVKQLGIGLTVAVLAVYMLLLLRQKRQYSNRFLLELAFLFAYTCVMFLPAMHERYDFPYLVLGVALILLDTRLIPAFIGILVVNLRAYTVFLFRAPAFDEIMPVINIACYVACSTLILRDGLRCTSAAAETFSVLTEEKESVTGAVFNR